MSTPNDSTKSPITERPWQISNADGRLHNVRRIKMANGEADTFRASIQTSDIRSHVVNLDFGYGSKDADRITYLIAAAPEMLDALREVVASGLPSEHDHPTMYKAWLRAANMIAKAEGR